MTNTSPTQLAARRCIPCEGGSAPLDAQQSAALLKQLANNWQCQQQQLQKEYTFKDFALALAFTNRVGSIAEAEGHHPDIFLGWGKVRLVIWTHAVNGLTESDFILAAKADVAFKL